MYWCSKLQQTFSFHLVTSPEVTERQDTAITYAPALVIGLNDMKRRSSHCSIRRQTTT